MVAVRFAGIAKHFGKVPALRPTELEVAPGEFLTLLGPSGSGKTTLLNICAGYLEPTEGRLVVDGRDITALPARYRNMGMVFQNYALFPHMSVFENVAYGLRVRRVPRPEIARRVAEVLRVVRLDGFAGRSVGQLSGGQQQRVALARAVVIEPAILLMDEPLGALDRQLRKEVQLEIRRMHVASPRTTLYVTHDQEEALVMSDRIAVMQSGRIVQVGSGQELYERPIDAFVARFLGESNLLTGIVRQVSGKHASVEVAGLERPIEGRASPGIFPGQAAAALIRPETVRVAPVGSGGLAARVVERVYLGELIAVRLILNTSGESSSQELWARRLAGGGPEGERVEVGWDRDRISILTEAPQ